MNIYEIVNRIDLLTLELESPYISSELILSHKLELANLNVKRKLWHTEAKQQRRAQYWALGMTEAEFTQEFETSF